MAAKDGLCLDHFYITMSGDEFESWKKIYPLFGRSFYDKVVTESDAWEGVYISSRLGIYFEVLGERRRGGLGICVSSRNQFYFDGRTVTDEMSELPWKKFDRNYPDGKLWYETLSTRDYNDLEKTLFNCWLMHYAPSHHAVTKRSEIPTVDRFTNLSMTVGAKWVSEVQDIYRWMPGTCETVAGGLRLSVPAKDGLSLTINLQVQPGDADFEFKAIEFKGLDAEGFVKPFTYEDAHFTAELVDGNGFVRRS